jgi:hypothetical protein
MRTDAGIGGRALLIVRVGRRPARRSAPTTQRHVPAARRNLHLHRPEPVVLPGAGHDRDHRRHHGHRSLRRLRVATRAALIDHECDDR